MNKSTIILMLRCAPKNCTLTQKDTTSIFILDSCTQMGPSMECMMVTGDAHALKLLRKDSSPT